MDNTNSHTGGARLRFHRCQLTLNTGFALARYNSQGKVFAFVAAALRLREGSKDKVFVIQPSDLIDHRMISPEGQTIVLEGEATRRRFNIDFRDCPEVTQRFEAMTPKGGYGVIYMQRMGLRPEFTYSETPIIAASWALPALREGEHQVGRSAQAVFPLAATTDDVLGAFDNAMGMSTAWYMAAQGLAIVGGNPKMPVGGPSVPAALNAAVNAENAFRDAKSPNRGQSSKPNTAQMTAFLLSLSPQEREALLQMEVKK